MKLRYLVFVLAMLLQFVSTGLSETEEEDLNTCLLESIKAADAELTVAELRRLCKTKLATSSDATTLDAKQSEAPSTPLQKRVAVESLAQELPFVLVPHKRNYLLPITYNSSPHDSPFENRDLDLDEAEVKFQFSSKARLAKGLFFGKGDIWLAYTNLSFWQAYNREESSPFRETNHEPEVFFDFHPDLSLGDWKLSLARFSLVHQSNGRSGDLSRSWNRIYALMGLENGNWYFGLRPWYRIPEDEKDSPDDSNGDDNPRMYQFMGYGELLALYRGDHHRFNLMFRNNLQSNNRIGLQVDWSFPLKDRVRGYVQYFNGYGESLIDYDDSTNRIGAGISFSEVL